jgi:hypothetical protein
MIRNILFTLLLATVFSIHLYSQDNIQIGNPYGITRYQSQGGLYDYSDPSSINIKVQLWGYVKFPGYYVVPDGSSINELISLAGGPDADALLNDVRVMKFKEDSSTVIQKYNYNELMWEDGDKSEIRFVPLQAGDVVVVPGEPRYFLRQDISFYLSIVTALASVAALLISIMNN